MDITTLNKTNPNRCNCVDYARSIVKSLPYGLWTLRNKKNIINSHKAEEGVVVIMDAGFWGHVGVVTKKDGRFITIQEANWRSCTMTERTGTESELKIVGYFDPNPVSNSKEIEKYNQRIADSRKKIIGYEKEIAKYEEKKKKHEQRIQAYQEKINKLK